MSSKAENSAPMQNDQLLAAIDGVRTEFLSGVTACRESVLNPGHDLGLSSDLRAALARRIQGAALASDQGLLSDQCDSDFDKIADGRRPNCSRFAAIVRFVDLVSVEPASAVEQDLAELKEAGLTEPQVVALCELIGFACFDVRVAFGLSLLAEAA